MSTKYDEKACHSPYFQNTVQKSPLEILRFPFPVAFSRKELMGHFDPHGYIIVKMTKCHPDVHTMSREVVARYPPVPASKLAPGDLLHLAQRGILNDTVYSLKLGIFRVPRLLVMRHVGGQF